MDMNENNAVTKRPGSVFWSGVLFWAMSLGVLATHSYLATKEAADIWSFVFAGLLLFAALLWWLSPRSLLTFYAGAASLVIFVIRGVLTAHTQYQLRTQFPDIVPQAIGSLAVSLLVAWVAFRFIFGCCCVFAGSGF